MLKVGQCVTINMIEKIQENSDSRDNHNIIQNKYTAIAFFIPLAINGIFPKQKNESHHTVC